MDKRRFRFLKVKTFNRFKFINYILVFIILSLLLNTHLTVKMIEEGKILFGGEASFIAFQINFIAIILALIISFLFFLHYGFGALSRMENILKKILEGDLSLRIHLRKRDVMKSFAEKLNAILDLLEEYKTNKTFSEKK